MFQKRVRDRDKDRYRDRDRDKDGYRDSYKDVKYYAGPRDKEAHTAFGVSNLSRMDSGMSLLVPCWTLGCRCLHF